MKEVDFTNIDEALQSLNKELESLEADNPNIRRNELPRDPRLQNLEFAMQLLGTYKELLKIYNKEENI
jgi:hypothetical protein